MVDNLGTWSHGQCREGLLVATYTEVGIGWSLGATLDSLTMPLRCWITKGIDELISLLINDLAMGSFSQIGSHHEVAIWGRDIAARTPQGTT